MSRRTSASRSFVESVASAAWMARRWPARSSAASISPAPNGFAGFCRVTDLVEIDQPKSGAAPRSVPTDVDHQAIEPRAERARLVVAVEVFAHPKEGVLSRVLRLIHATQQPQRRAKHHPLVALDETAEGLHVAIPGPTHPGAHVVVVVPLG